MTMHCRHELIRLVPLLISKPDNKPLVVHHTADCNSHVTALHQNPRVLVPHADRYAGTNNTNGVTFPRIKYYTQCI
jgi:hypothetical protein